MNYSDTKLHEEMHKRYTQHLAEAMGTTKEIIASNLIWEMGAEAPRKPSYIVEVDFDK